jgi:uncharacterized protein (TIGR03118 family)
MVVQWIWVVIVILLAVVGVVLGSVALSRSGQNPGGSTGATGDAGVDGSTGLAGSTGLNARDACVDDGYQPYMLRTSLTGFAGVTVDVKLINPWGAIYDETGSALDGNDLLWIANAGSGTLQRYRYSIPTGSYLNWQPELELLQTVTVETGSGPFLIGLDWNPNPNAFTMQTPDGVTGPAQILAHSGRRVYGYNPDIWPFLVIVMDNSSLSPGYKGMVIYNNILYLADQMNANVQMFSSTYQPLGSFTDPSTLLVITNGLHPYNVAVIDGRVYVTFSADLRGSQLGTSFVSMFMPDGTFVTRFAAFGDLSQPWGMQKVTADMSLSGVDEILFANFGDAGLILRFRLSDGLYLGQLRNQYCTPIPSNGIWAVVQLKRAQPLGQFFLTQGPAEEAAGILTVLIPTKPPE